MSTEQLKNVIPIPNNRIFLVEVIQHNGTKSRWLFDEYVFQDFQWNPEVVHSAQPINEDAIKGSHEFVPSLIYFLYANNGLYELL